MHDACTVCDLRPNSDAERYLDEVPQCLHWSSERTLHNYHLLEMMSLGSKYQETTQNWWNQAYLLMTTLRTDTHINILIVWKLGDLRVSSRNLRPQDVRIFSYVRFCAGNPRPLTRKRYHRHTMTHSHGRAIFHLVYTIRTLRVITGWYISIPIVKRHESSIITLKTILFAI